MKVDDKWYGKDFDWYVKWAATVMVLISVTFRNAGIGYRELDLAFGLLGTLLWLWVSVMWKDRALIILNSVMNMLLASALLKEFM